MIRRNDGRRSRALRRRIHARSSSRTSGHRRFDELRARERPEFAARCRRGDARRSARRRGANAPSCSRGTARSCPHACCRWPAAGTWGRCSSRACVCRHIATARTSTISSPCRRPRRGSSLASSRFASGVRGGRPPGRAGDRNLGSRSRARRVLPEWSTRRLTISESSPSVCSSRVSARCRGVLRPRHPRRTPRRTLRSTSALIRAVRRRRSRRFASPRASFAYGVKIVGYSATDGRSGGRVPGRGRPYGGAFATARLARAPGSGAQVHAGIARSGSSRRSALPHMSPSPGPRTAVRERLGDDAPG